MREHANIGAARQVFPPGHGDAISYFPALLDDELLYSTVARYQRQVANSNARETKRRLFGTSTLPATLPGNLSRFLAHLPPGVITVDEVIARHTIFPYLAPFIGSNAERKTLSAMRDHDGLAVKVSLDLNGRSPEPEYDLRFCLECVREQHENANPAYWQRVHQLPGVGYCALHASPLISRCDKCGPFDYRRSIMPLPGTKCYKCGNRFAPLADSRPGPVRTAETRFAVLSAELLRTNLRVAKPGVLSSVYAKAISAAHLITEGPWRESRAPLEDRVLEYWGSALLNRLGQMNGNRFWVRVPIVPDVATTYHPFFHLPVIGGLFGSFSEFEAEVAKYHP